MKIWKCSQTHTSRPFLIRVSTVRYGRGCHPSLGGARSLTERQGSQQPELQGATKYPDHHVTCREAETGTYGMVGVGADRLGVDVDGVYLHPAWATTRIRTKRRTGK